MKPRIKTCNKETTLFGKSFPKNSIFLELESTVMACKNFPKYKGKSPFLKVMIYDKTFGFWTSETRCDGYTRLIWEAHNKVGKVGKESPKDKTDYSQLMKRGERGNVGKIYNDYDFKVKSFSTKPMDGRVVTDTFQNKDGVSVSITYTEIQESSKFMAYDASVTFDECYWEKGTNKPQVAYKPVKDDKSKKNEKYKNTMVAHHVFSGDKMIKFVPDAARTPMELAFVKALKKSNKNWTDEEAINYFTTKFMKDYCAYGEEIAIASV